MRRPAGSVAVSDAGAALLAGVGAWLGVPLTVYVFIVAGLAGGLYALLLLALKGRTGSVAGDPQRSLPQVMRQADRRQRLVPFATMILIGVIATLVWSSLP